MVCRKWRSVALNTPTIWGILGDVRISKKTAAKKGNAHELFLKMVLKRSKGSDLWIYVSAPFMEYDGKSHPIIELLCQYAKQWRVFGIDSSCTILSAFRPVKYNLPRLHSLSLALSGDIGTELGDIFVDVPLLSDVNIRGIYPSHLVLPYHQLSSYQEGTFEHSYSAVGGLADVLQHSANLEHIRLSGMCFNFSVAQHTILKSKRTEMPKLRTLATKLDIALAHQAHTFFDTLVTPHLEEVRIDGFPGDIIAVLQTLILRSIAPNAQFPLKVLHIRSTNRVVDNVGYLPSLFEVPQVEDLDLDSLLLEVPHLEDLDIDFPPLQVVFGLIAGTKSSRTAGSSTPTARSKGFPFVPKLRRLILRGSSLDITSNAKALTALGRARCEGPEVHTHSGHSTPNDIADLRIPQVTRLEQFRLVTNTLEEAFAAQGHLNGWWDAGPSSRQSRPGSRVETPAAEGKSTPSVAIKFNATDNESLAHDQVQIDYLGFLEWRKALYMEIPELNGEAPSRSRKLDFGFASRLDRFLSTFEQARIDERNIYDLYVRTLYIHADISRSDIRSQLSQLHWSLRQLGQLQENHIPGDNKYHFRQRSEALVTKWDRCMQANIADVTPRPGALKWAFKQPVSLVYVPDDDRQYIFSLNRDLDPCAHSSHSPQKIERRIELHLWLRG